MIVGADGRVAGSIDVAQLKHLWDETSDEELKAHYASLVSSEIRQEWLDQAAEPAPEPEAEPEPAAVLERPTDYASKADWVAFAVAKGADEADAGNATKAELIELYGQEG